MVNLGGPLKFTMVDWSEPKKPIEDGLGGDRGQVVMFFPSPKFN